VRAFRFVFPVCETRSVKRLFRDALTVAQSPKDRQ
jgi:hypothetical protein